MKSEIENRASFNQIRYSQCWEDADILIEALKVQKTDNILSIASAGDNAFALLAQNPNHILAVDLSFEQIACCELRKACYQNLTYDEFINFSGVLGTQSTDNDNRMIIYKKLKQFLPEKVEKFWSSHMPYIADGFMNVGKFENYFSIFREKVLPKVHNKKKVLNLLEEKSLEEQQTFYDKEWNTFKWRTMFKIFFSKSVMGKLGRDPEFYKYVKEIDASKVILEHSKHALTNIPTYSNPYLTYILKGKYNKEHLPYALRKENFNKIKENLHKIEFKQISIEEAVNTCENFDCYNLSDIFEYMSQESMDKLYELIINHSNNNARVAYWNMLVDRKCLYTHRVKYNKEICHSLWLKDKAFFYKNFILEEITND